ncbi:LuxR family transcriptional regulator [Limimaricola variabilis]|jgi:LuxR family transcriptional regulator|uniref:LuxR family transcriptional regulator n=1 Tax=Limimaricola variabilis TaxID=1492771 RepID=A0ABR6HKA4_9RHOB|nr:LuxR family transcriptional regulator [Limimaricola variabilis]MBB3710986.1 LuxR family transcriptional regulator [Limimaricola variabilis]WPY95535.1 LuxR C-terminal-related transcriptional regulator [Limimaricola variabilis]
MTGRIDTDLLERLSPAGHYIALRIGFAFPLEEYNHLPKNWIDLYTVERMLPDDPAMRWGHANRGVTRWSALEDPKGVFAEAWKHGLRYGAVAAHADEGTGLRSIGLFARVDREFSDRELGLLHEILVTLHAGAAPPSNLTQAEIEVLRMVKDGYRLKQIAHALGVTEGAIKQRLKNARTKLGANTATQAATLASGFGLI